MAEEKEPFCRDGLKPGMIVKDDAGRLKQVTRIEGDEVYWRYTEGDSPAEEMSTDYEEFIDHHFVVPQSGTPRKSA